MNATRGFPTLLLLLSASCATRAVATRPAPSSVSTDSSTDPPPEPPPEPSIVHWSVPPRAGPSAPSEPGFELEQSAPASQQPATPPGDRLWETGEDRSYFIPAAEIVTFEFLLNLHNRWFVDEETYGTDWESIKENLHTGWGVDNDPFETNQLWHPYAGSIYMGFARSAGQGFWSSFVYTFLGSALWEVAGETTRPSLNDQLATGVGGTFLGEALFRIASLILEGNDESPPDGWQEFGAALVSPPTWFNRHAFGDRFKPVFKTGNPAVFSRVGIGASYNTHVSDRDLTDSEKRLEGVADFRVDAGLPGKAGYKYERPFDHFQFEGTFTTSPDAHVENLSIRGLLFGTDYGDGDYRGVAGLYGSYDYLSPELFRFSSTALSFGSAGQYWMTPSLVLQGSAFAGVGYGAAGTIADAEVDRDYHYGVCPQGVMDLKLIMGERAFLEVEGREYYVSATGSNQHGGHENIGRVQASLTTRIVDRHAVSLQYILSARDAPDTPTSDRHQNVSTARLVYTYLLGSAQGTLGAAGHPKSQ